MLPYMDNWLHMSLLFYHKRLVHTYDYTDPFRMLLFTTVYTDTMAKTKPNCCICGEKASTLRIQDGNPDYHGRSICRICQQYRQLLMETR